MATVDLATVIKRNLIGSATPTVGTYNVGDIIWNQAPAAGGHIGRVCTVAGTPGTWKTFGAIEGFEGVINVLDYGVVADSNGTTGNGTDNRTAINAAYTAAVAANRALYFPASTGWYRYTSYLDFTSASAPLVVFGDGIDKSKLYNDELTFVGMQVQSQLSVHFYGFTLKKRTSGLTTKTGTASTIFMTSCDQVLVENIEIDSGDAISLYLSGCTKAIVRDCFIHDAFDGIHFEDSDDCMAIGNYCWNNKDDAIGSVNNSGSGALDQRIVIMGNSIKDCSSRGIIVNGAVQATVVGNNVNNTQEAGIHVEVSATWGDDTHEVVIANNTVTDGGMKAGGSQGYGIYVLRIDSTNALDNVLIANNIIKTPRFMFIRVGKLGQAVTINRVSVIGNQCYGPVVITNDGGRDLPGWYPGISLENCIDSMIAENFVDQPYTTGVAIHGTLSAGVNVIRNNVITRPNIGLDAVFWMHGVVTSGPSSSVYIQGNVMRDPANVAPTMVNVYDSTVLSNTNNHRTTAGPA